MWSIVLTSLVLFGAKSTFAANWAVLVAGSNGWYNYRHQADVCHAYQILHKNGIPDSNIIVMMYDDLAQNRENPTKGVLINHPDGPDVYKGVPHDYIGKDVTPKNFLNVLLGNKKALQGTGSGKVLESGPDDNVFIFFTDHGAVGLVAFPSGVLYAADFNVTLTKMHQDNKYKRMVIYIEACESGSMLENILVDNIDIYATTASNAEESSYACYYDEKRQTYLGDVYSVVWMEDSDQEKLDQESLYQQFVITQKTTNTSHVMQYGDLALSKAHNVSEFQTAGNQVQSPSSRDRYHRWSQLTKNDAVPTEDVRLAVISRRLANAGENSMETNALERELNQFLEDRTIIFTRLNEIASTALATEGVDDLESATDRRLKLTQHACYKSVTQRVDERCFDLQNELVLKKLYILANLCEMGLDDFTIHQAIDQVCRERLHFDY